MTELVLLEEVNTAIVIRGMRALDRERAEINMLLEFLEHRIRLFVEQRFNPFRERFPEYRCKGPVFAEIPLGIFDAFEVGDETRGRFRLFLDFVYPRELHPGKLRAELIFFGSGVRDTKKGYPCLIFEEIARRHDGDQFRMGVTFPLAVNKLPSREIGTCRARLDQLMQEIMKWNIQDNFLLQLRVFQEAAQRDKQ